MSKPITTCLICYQPADSGKLYHSKCATQLFGHPDLPLFSYTLADLEALGIKMVGARRGTTGVQAKISAGVENRNGYQRITVVGQEGRFIIKMPSLNYPYMVELEDVTMHMAEAAGIATARHCLLPLADDTLAYITLRMDRTRTSKLHMEDFCQISGRLTEDKYRGSYEQIANLLRKISARPGLDLLALYELIVFSFFTGNADMHLKNFSMLEQAGDRYSLAPAYDLLPTALLLEQDQEEMALTLNARKRKIAKADFDRLAIAFKLTPKQAQASMDRLLGNVPIWEGWIERSFLPKELKGRYYNLIGERIERVR